MGKVYIAKIWVFFWIYWFLHYSRSWGRQPYQALNDRFMLIGKLIKGPFIPFLQCSWCIFAALLTLTSRAFSCAIWRWAWTRLCYCQVLLLFFYSVIVGSPIRQLVSICLLLLERLHLRQTDGYDGQKHTSPE